MHTFGFPACAGIDLTPDGTEICKIRLPRMRGDRPILGSLRDTRKRASPHALVST